MCLKTSVTVFKRQQGLDKRLLKSLSSWQKMAFRVGCGLAITYSLKILGVQTSELLATYQKLDVVGPLPSSIPPYIHTYIHTYIGADG